jgi:hypothetical protein
VVATEGNEEPEAVVAFAGACPPPDGPAVAGVLAAGSPGAISRKGAKALNFFDSVSFAPWRLCVTAAATAANSRNDVKPMA